MSQAKFCPYAQANPLSKTSCQRVLSMAQVRVLRSLQEGESLRDPSVRTLAHLQMLRAIKLVKPPSARGSEKAPLIPQSWEITHRGKAALLLPKTQRGGRDLGTRLERDYMRKVLTNPGGAHGLPRNSFKKAEFRGWVERRELPGQEGAWGVFPTALGIVYGVAALGIQQYDPLLPVLARGAQLKATEDEWNRLQDLKQRGWASRFNVHDDREWGLLPDGADVLARAEVGVLWARKTSPCPFGISGEMDREKEMTCLRALVHSNSQPLPTSLEVAA